VRWSVVQDALSREGIVKRWPWRRILSFVALALVLAGVAPATYLFCWGHAHHFEPLSVPFPRGGGEYASPLFVTDLDDDYQVEVYFLPPNQSPLNLDWKMVDDRGNVIGAGSYSELASGANDAILGHYCSKRGLRQRAILNIHQGFETTSEDVRLHIGLPERGLDQAYGFAAALIWAAKVAGPGAVILIVLALQNAIRRKTSVIVS
jgi:hypothetical protein